MKDEQEFSDTPVTIVRIRLDGPKVWFLKQFLFLLCVLFLAGIGLLGYGWMKVSECQSNNPRLSWEECLKKEKLPLR